MNNKERLITVMGEQTSNKEEVIQMIKNRADLKFEYTHGIGYKCPTIHHKPISKDKALELVTNESILDVTLIDDVLLAINTYSDSDLW